MRCDQHIREMHADLHRRCRLPVDGGGSTPPAWAAFILSQQNTLRLVMMVTSTPVVQGRPSPGVSPASECISFPLSPRPPFKTAHYRTLRGPRCNVMWNMYVPSLKSASQKKRPKNFLVQALECQFEAKIWGRPASSLCIPVDVSCSCPATDT